jgi:hypothetical protein
MTSEDTAPAETAANPYASPKGISTAKLPRTRWRLIPAILMVTYGMMGIIFSLAELSVRLYQWTTYGRASGVTLAPFAGAVLLATGSVLWMVAAVLCWKRDWASMVPVLGIALVATTVGQYLL